MLPHLQEGYHVYFGRPSMSSPLPPRRYQVKTPISKSTVNGLPFRTWKCGAEVPLGPYARISTEALRKRPRHDSFYDDEQIIDGEMEQHGEGPSYYASMLPPCVKRFKLADGHVDLFSEVEASALRDDLPNTLFFTAESASYNMVDLNRNGLPPFRGRRRIGRGGRVMWDRVPNDAFLYPVPPIPPTLSRSIEVAFSAPVPSTASVNVNSQDANSTVQAPDKLTSCVHLSFLPSTTLGTEMRAKISAVANGVVMPGSTAITAGLSASSAANGESSSASPTHLAHSEQQQQQQQQLQLQQHNGTMTAVTTPEPSSTDPMSGESTIATGSGSHSPEESSPNFFNSPNSKPDVCTAFDTLTVLHPVQSSSSTANNTSLMMMDEPMPENLEEMPWL